MLELNFKSKLPITKGWSGDKKYSVTTIDDKKLLLRISNIDQLEHKMKSFERMKMVATLGVSMCHPIDFGVCDEGVYLLQSWIEGNDVSDLLPELTNKEAYTYGYEAGDILRKIHTIPSGETDETWEVRFNRKIDRKIQMYQECPIQYEKGQSFIDCINANRHLLRERPQCYQHGDYHIGNMMINNDGKVVIIDFDRDDWGDPWEEFNRIVWCAIESPSFATGMVNGYFHNQVPMEFWTLLALYISNNALSSLPWAIPFGQEEIDTMINLSNQILVWYNDMQDVIPSWYLGVKTWDET